MRKVLGAIVSGVVILFISVVIAYYRVPMIKEFIDTNTTLATFLGLVIGLLGVLIAFLLWWYPHRNERRDTEPEPPTPRRRTEEQDKRRSRKWVGDFMNILKFKDSGNGTILISWQKGNISRDCPKSIPFADPMTDEDRKGLRWYLGDSHRLHIVPVQDAL